MSSSTGARPVSLVLAGNPNVGKSAVFNALTGTYVDVSNFPGTTVELVRGRMGVYEIVDTPGVYGVSSFNEEERVARDIILTGDIVVNVVDVVHLERDLFLTLQLLDMGKQMVVVLNMSDEARRQGVAIDQARLEELLGVPVIATAAVKGTDIEDLKSVLPAARAGHGDPALQEGLADLQRRISLRSEALLVLEGDEEVSARLGLEPGTQRDTIYRERRRRVDVICAEVVRETREGAGFAARLSRWMLHPLTGIPMLLGLL